MESCDYVKIQNIPVKRYNNQIKASYKVRKEICMHVTNKGLSSDYAKSSIKYKNNNIKNEKPG